MKALTRHQKKKMNLQYVLAFLISYPHPLKAIDLCKKALDTSKQKHISNTRGYTAKKKEIYKIY